jgi:pimeloyl-ACP methyl ester carboxylesterase
MEYPSLLSDRWEYDLEQNALTPIRSLAHRVALLTGLDLRPILPAIPTEILLLQGNEDRIVPRRDFEVLRSALTRAEAAILPTVGHQPHMTHAESMAQLIHQWLLPCAEGPGGCTAQGA